MSQVHCASLGIKNIYQETEEVDCQVRIRYGINEGESNQQSAICLERRWYCDDELP